MVEWLMLAVVVADTVRKLYIVGFGEPTDD